MSSMLLFDELKLSFAATSFDVRRAADVTDEIIEEGYFGCAGVANIPRLQDKLLSIGKQGYRHHVGVTFGHVEIPVREAFTTYLNYEIIDL